MVPSSHTIAIYLYLLHRYRSFMDADEEFLKLARFCGFQDSKAQVTALQLIIGTLQRTRVFGVENRDTLTHKATGVRQRYLLVLTTTPAYVSL